MTAKRGVRPVDWARRGDAAVCRAFRAVGGAARVDRWPRTRSIDCALQRTVAGALVRSLDTSELGRAFRVVTPALLAEVARADDGLVTRLADTLKELISTVAAGS